jgi:acetyl-CoA carboxylase biotin carboxylase subunit
MHRALLELTVDGVETSREFHLRVMEDAEFRAGAIDIQWLERRLPSLLDGRASDAEIRNAAIAAALIAHEERRGRVAPPSASTTESAWGRLARVDAVRD